MRQLKKVTDLLIYGNFWIAAGAACMAWQTYLLLGLETDFFYVALVFVATLFVYDIDRLLGMDGIHKSMSERHRWIARHQKLLYIITGICAMLLMASVFFMPWRVILFLGHLGIVSVAYSIPMVMQAGKRVPLRSVSLMKIFLIQYVWLAATAFLPAVASGISILDTEVLLTALKRGLFIFAITLPFDIRDMETDKIVGVRTLPSTLGVKRTRVLSVTCLLAFIVLVFVHFGFNSPYTIAMCISAATTLPLLWISKKDMPEYFFTGLLDGTIVFQFLLVYLAQHWQV